MEQVDVSVIIPAYNSGDLIIEAVESALGQTLPGVEVIVVDNGSTDGLARRLTLYLDRIRFIRFDQNQKPAAARNAGIRAARGRYLALLDADDVFMPERLERLVEFLDAHPEFSIATTDAYYLFGDAPSTRSYFSVPLLRFHQEDQDVHIMRSNFVGNKLIFRRELFRRYGLYDETLWAEDWERNIALLTAGERVGFVREPLAYHRVTPGSLTGSMAPEMLADRLKVLERWLARDLRPEVRRAGEEALAQARWEHAWSEAVVGRRAEIRSVLWRLVRCAPWHLRLRALALLLLPVGLTARVRDARARFIRSRGAHWALHQAAPELQAGDFRRARGHLAAAALFSYPARTKVNAALWLLLPPLRKRLTARILSDPLLEGEQAPRDSH